MPSVTCGVLASWLAGIDCISSTASLICTCATHCLSTAKGHPRASTAPQPCPCLPAFASLPSCSDEDIYGALEGSSSRPASIMNPSPRQVGRAGLGWAGRHCLPGAWGWVCAGVLPCPHVPLLLLFGSAWEFCCFCGRLATGCCIDMMCWSGLPPGHPQEVPASCRTRPSPCPMPSPALPCPAALLPQFGGFVRIRDRLSQTESDTAAMVGKGHVLDACLGSDRALDCFLLACSSSQISCCGSASSLQYFFVRH